MSENKQISRKSLVRATLLADVAEMYFIQQLNQSQIATQIGLTRSMVSRLLSEARQKGIVQVYIKRPLVFDDDLGEQLADKLGINSAKVFYLSNPDDIHILQRLGEAGARIMEESILPNMIIGIPWGTSISASIDHFSIENKTHAKIIQLVGAVGAHNYDYDGHGIVQRLAQKIGGEGYFLNAPFVLESPEIVQGLLKNPAIKETMTMAKQCDLAFLGLGSIELENSSFYKAGYVNPEELLYLKEQGAIGGVCGLHFDIQGNPRGLDFQSRLITIDRDTLIAIPRKIAVAAGSGKVKPIIGAARCGYINEIVTDYFTAQSILEYIDKETD
ncbi:MAG: sugar-binding transcriptional regulator [Anaerolineaceae bacterium]|nr:sugar-binding transcriptional regulator [Anaerolineaceae bacterium]